MCIGDFVLKTLEKLLFFFPLSLDGLRLWKERTKNLTEILIKDRFRSFFHVWNRGGAYWSGPASSKQNLCSGACFSTQVITPSICHRDNSMGACHNWSLRQLRRQYLCTRVINRVFSWDVKI